MFNPKNISKQIETILDDRNLPVLVDYRLYKKFTSIHCEVATENGLVEMEGFPVKKESEALLYILAYMLRAYFTDEANYTLEDIKKEYSRLCGDFDERVYIFQNTLSIIKEYDSKFVDTLAKGYLKELNEGLNERDFFQYDSLSNVFLRMYTKQNIALVLRKDCHHIYVYEHECEDLYKNTTGYIYKESKEIENGMSYFVHPIGSEDNIQIDVLNPKFIEETPKHIYVGVADEIIVHSYIEYEGKKLPSVIRTTLDGNHVKRIIETKSGIE